MKKGVLENFAKLTGKHLYQSLFFNKIAGLRPGTLLKKRLWHRSFPVNFGEISKTTFSYRTPWWLLLHFAKRKWSYRENSSKIPQSFWTLVFHLQPFRQLSVSCLKLMERSDQIFVCQIEFVRKNKTNFSAHPNFKLFLDILHFMKIQESIFEEINFRL